MGKYIRILRALRDIALEHGCTEQPDLAVMARELGRSAHQDAQLLASRLGVLRRRQRGFERWLLAERNTPPVTVMVMAWPPGHVTPIHDHAGVWGLEMALVGALEVQSYQRNADTGDLRLNGHDWLGAGDSTWFDGDAEHVHRCRNLSRFDTALTLHVYGGDLATYSAYEHIESSGRWIARPQHGALAGRLHS